MSDLQLTTTTIIVIPVLEMREQQTKVSVHIVSEWVSGDWSGFDTLHHEPA